MSRYALWLVPLCVPALLVLESAGGRGRAILAVFAAFSLVTAVDEYHPRREQRYVEPSPVAQWLWTHWPGADNPLPEVFAERTSGAEEGEALPAATDGCEKVLLVGDGSRYGVWPLWCRPHELPPRCAAVATFCYANRRGSGYDFLQAAPQPGFERHRPAAWYWTGSPGDELARFLSQFTRSAVRDADPSQNYAELFAGKALIGPRRARINQEATLVWLARPRAGAWVAVPPGPPRRAVLVDPRQARVLANIAVDPFLPTRVALPQVSPLLLVVAAEGLVPAGLGSH